MRKEKPPVPRSRAGRVRDFTFKGLCDPAAPWRHQYDVSNHMTEICPDPKKFDTIRIFPTREAQPSSFAWCCVGAARNMCEPATSP